jgi:hypothetical protein
MEGACSTHKKNEKLEKSRGKRSLGRHRRRWEDNIKMSVKYTG